MNLDSLHELTIDIEGHSTASVVNQIYFIQFNKLLSDSLARLQNFSGIDLDALTQERDALTQERDALMDSTIWRLTGPLRKILNILKQLK